MLKNFPFHADSMPGSQTENYLGGTKSEMLELLTVLLFNLFSPISKTHKVVRQKHLPIFKTRNCFSNVCEYSQYRLLHLTGE